MRSKLAPQPFTICIYAPVKEWQKRRLWELFSGALPPHPTRRFNLFLGPRRQACKVFHEQTMGHVFDTLPRPLPERPILGSSSSVPKMDLSRSTLRAMAGDIYRMLFPSGFRPPSLSLGVYSHFSRIHVSSHGRTTIAIPACVFPPTLDDSRFPRRDVDGTGEISCR